MVLTALNLILGGKSDSDFVRSGQERLIVSGKFEIGEALSLIIEDAGGIVEENEVIINRSVTNQGKSKISLGGAVSSATQVSEMAQELIEIHAQASSARLSKGSVQLELLDSFAGHENLVSDYSIDFEEHLNLRKRVAELERELRRTTAQMQSFSEAPDFVDTSASMRRAHDVLARECKGLRQATSPG